MSMISTYIDELRRYADMADGAFPMLASVIRDATDIIWQLHDDLQRANAKLRQQLVDVTISCERLEMKCAKLREYINLKETCWKYVGWCDECPYNGADDEHDDFNCMIQEKINLLAHELGIEV